MQYACTNRVPIGCRLDCASVPPAGYPPCSPPCILPSRSHARCQPPPTLPCSCVSVRLLDVDFTRDAPPGHPPHERCIAARVHASGMNVLPCCMGICWISAMAGTRGSGVRGVLQGSVVVYCPVGHRLHMCTDVVCQFPGPQHLLRCSDRGQKVWSRVIVAWRFSFFNLTAIFAAFSGGVCQNSSNCFWLGPACSAHVTLVYPARTGMVWFAALL